MVGHSGWDVVLENLVMPALHWNSFLSPRHLEALLSVSIIDP